jgi:hypothetical protein
LSTSSTATPVVIMTPDTFPLNAGSCMTAWLFLAT